MSMRNKRVLWLLNHTTLREGEVSLLLKLGYEVYTPKKLTNKFSRSSSITHEFDGSLSIPPALLKRMNNFNFYESPWPVSLKHQINRYFGIAFCGKFENMLNAVGEGFKGELFLRSFGAIGELTNNAFFYEKFCSAALLDRIKQQRHIWFAASYQSVIENEPYWLQRIALFLPLGLPPSYSSHMDLWRPMDNRIFFVCPEIQTINYYQEIYQEFKETFGDLPHVIAGVQPKPLLNDPNVVNFLPREEYQKLMITCKVMFYHSREERHLHYHPLEAIHHGMPVIFMADGMLGELAGGKLPGACETLEEAREKVLRVLSNDLDFISSVVESQKTILEHFKPEYIQDVWRKNFLPATTQVRQTGKKSAVGKRSKTKDLSVGIWLHETNPGGFTGEGISRLLAFIVRSALKREDIEIKIACVSWVRQSVINYMNDLGVDGSKIKFLTVNDTPPFLFTLYNWWDKRSKRAPRTRRNYLLKFVTETKILLNSVFKRIISLRGISGVLALMAIGFLGAPFLLIFAILYSIRRGYQRMSTRVQGSAIAIRIRASIQNLVELFWRITYSTYHRMINAELDLLMEKAGRDRTIDGWYFPYPRVENISKFRKPVVVAVPDIVYLDFPTPFLRQAGELFQFHTGIEQTILGANSIITFSNYVRENHVIKQKYKSAENTHVIRHASINVRDLITKRSGEIPMRYHAGRIINEYFEKPGIEKTNQSPAYLQALPFGEFEYILISSQTRPHKNHLNLLKAYKKLLREKYMNIKLILTGNISQEMQDYIHEEKLHLDVISLNYLPPKIHAAFYACARLVIVPTLFEGGFPFVFSEALSVNTPVVMSNIPVVHEVIPQKLIDMICFDPYSIESMAEKISWALQNRSALLETEQKIYKSLQHRNWDDVTDEYIRVFKSAFGKGKPGSSRSLSSNQQVCAIHIPKTAGTSFFKILALLLFNTDDAIQLGWYTFFSGEDVSLGAYKAISGHFPYEITRILADEPLLITFLRNPIQRSLSQFVQSQNFPQHWAYERVRKMGLEQYVNDPDLANEINNVQTWMLGLTINKPINTVRELMNPRELSSRVIDEISRNKHHPVWLLGLHIGTMGQPLQRDNDTIRLSQDRVVSLKLARERLEKISFFGLTERLRDSINIFTYTFGLPPIYEIPQERIATEKVMPSEVPAHVMEKLYELNTLDIKLYKYAQSLFEIRYRTMLKELSAKYGADVQNMSIEALLEKDYWLNIKNNFGLQKSLKYEFTQTYPRSGWSYHYREGGKHHLWSAGNGVSSIELPLDRNSNLGIHFEVAQAIAVDVLESLILKVDGQPIQLARTQKDNSYFFTGVIPHNRSKSEIPTRLSFHVSRTDYLPQLSGKYPGPQRVGIALGWVEIMPDFS